MTEVVGQGVGARVRRKEDSRLLRGRGSYVSDMVLPGQCEVAFLRSPIAHGRIRRIVKPPDSVGRVFIRSDLHEAAAIIAPTTVPGYKLSEWHPLAHDKVRFVGEAVAMCVAPTRAEAEDLAEEIEVEFDWHGWRTRILDTDTEMGEQNVTSYRIVEGDPLSATVICDVDVSLARPGWGETRTRATSTMTCDAERFTVTTTIDAFHDGVRVHARAYTHQFPRDGA